MVWITRALPLRRDELRTAAAALAAAGGQPESALRSVALAALNGDRLDEFAASPAAVAPVLKSTTKHGRLLDVQHRHGVRRARPLRPSVLGKREHS